MKYLLPLWILITSRFLQALGVLEWTVIRKVTDYGQNVTLFCHVSNCCPQDSGWDRYSPEQRTLFIDIKTGRHNAKYDGKVSRDGYTLIIQNLTKSDLNVSYSCVYGVTIGEVKFLLEEDVFKKISTTQPDVPTGKSNFSGGKIAAVIAGCVVLMSALFYICVCRRIRRIRRPRYSGHELFEDRLEETERLKYIDLMQNSETHKRYFVKIMIVGKNSVGKTCLLRNLLKEDITNVSSTDGIHIEIHRSKINIENGKWIIEKDIPKPKETRDSIELHSMDNSKQLIMPSDLMSDLFTATSISKSSSNNYARCGLWDFAGQKEFYCTHQAFLTSSAIYLVVADMKTNFVTEQKKKDTTEDDISSLSDLQEEALAAILVD